jgi:hypothetical protein
MTRMPSVEVYSCAHLVGFWQLSDRDAHYFGVLERDQNEQRSTLAIGRVSASGSQVIKRIANQDTRIRWLDANRVGADLFFVLEINQGRALQTVRARIAALVDPAVAQVAFEDLRDLGLSPRQVEKVQIPPEKLWNVADILAPKQWLFSPRLVRGEVREPQVIANTANGYAVLVGSQDTADAIADAGEPQAHLRSGRHLFAFLRYPEPNFPFWSLPRYEGERTAQSGDLHVGTREASTNLSRDLQIGPVIAFALTADSAGTPWVFALKAGPAAAEVIALVQRGQSWTVAERWALDGPAERLTVEYAANAFHVLYAVRTTGWSVRYQSWPGIR